MTERRAEFVDPAFLHASEEPEVRAFLERRDDLLQMVQEVVFLLTHRIRQHDVDVSSVHGRVKTLLSFIDKFRRKRYESMEDFTDLAGVRVVCLHPAQLEIVDRIIDATFRVLEREGKSVEAIDRFGYNATHYVVTLRDDASGDRSRLLRGFKCEIQVRTVLQDAWAIIDHHLHYKREGRLQPAQTRRLHALAAMLETADQQVDDVARSQLKYVAWLNSPRTTIKRLRRETVNDESIFAYLRKKFPDLSPAVHPHHIVFFLRALNQNRFCTISTLDDAVNLTHEARQDYHNEPFSSTGLAHLSLAVACVDLEYRNRVRSGPQALAIADAFRTRVNSQDAG